MIVDDKEYEAKENANGVINSKEYTKNFQFLPVFFFCTFTPGNISSYILFERRERYYWKEQNFGTYYITVCYKVTKVGGVLTPYFVWNYIYVSNIAFRTSSSVIAANASHRVLHIPNNLFTPPNQLQSVPQGQSIPQGLNLPKNLIVAPACTQMCPPLIGTQKDDIIIATAVTDASIYGLGGNDVLRCGPGACKAFAGPADNNLMANVLDTATGKLYGGSGNNFFIGGAGANLMLGGKGNDQFYLDQGMMLC